MQGNKPMFFERFTVFAHRGASDSVLENTIEALRLSCQRGDDAVEFDVMLTKDGVPVVFHDETLSRLAGVNRRIDDTTFDELKKIPLKNVYAAPSLDDVLDVVKAYYTPVNIEIKPSRTDLAQATTSAVVDALNRKGLLYQSPVKVLLSSFSQDALIQADRAAPHLEKSVLTENLTEADVEFAHRINAVAVHAPVQSMSRENVAYVKDCGLKMCLYTVNDPILAVKARAVGIDGIFTDKVKDIQKVLSQE